VKPRLIAAIAIGSIAGAGIATLSVGGSLLLIGLPMMLWLYRRLFFPSSSEARFTTVAVVATIVVVFACASIASAMHPRCILTIKRPDPYDIRW
jgi:hypothetical protein